MSAEDFPLATDPDRDRGVISTADREFLLGLSDDLSQQGEYRALSRIRDRTYNAFLDFTLLFEHLDDDQRSKIWDRHGRVTDAALWQGLVDTVAFALYGDADPIHTFLGDAAAINVWSALDADADQFDPIRYQLEEAVSHAGERAGYLVTDVSITIESEPWPEPKHIQEKFDRGEELSTAELAILLDAKGVDTDDLSPLLED